MSQLAQGLWIGDDSTQGNTVRQRMDVFTIGAND